ncbi:FG-GAP repeat protein [Candidatus Entotheonella palauensis]|nr:FG-GAP repeat protein [Candidatus Entotheonella palauensis]
MSTAPTFPSGNWSYQTRIVSSNPNSTYFGYTVAISGNYALVSYRDKHDRAPRFIGVVDVLKRNGQTWTPQAKLTSPDQNDELFGKSLAISGDHAVVGTSGAAYVYSRNGQAWTRNAKLTGDPNQPNDGFGLTVAIDGDTIVVGAANWTNGGQIDHSGAAYVFGRNGTQWSQLDILTANDPDTGSDFGCSVAISGDHILIGASWADSGAAYVFGRNGTKWSQPDILTADDPQPYSGFGSSVAISGDHILIGASGLLDQRGAAYVFG